MGRIGLVAMGSCLMLIEMGGWAIMRYSAAWWCLEVTQMVVLCAAFSLIIKRISQLEKKVAGIASYVRKKLTDESDRPKPRMLRSVS